MKLRLGLNDIDTRELPSGFGPRTTAGDVVAGLDLNLSDLASVRAFSACFLATGRSVAMLIGNAAIMAPAGETAEPGLRPARRRGR
ncbi:MAG: hypothetical protein H7270_02900 [Dermatophilaceae bacterium]|nr:hypothetical protein [Dermatophilaceae bacterium]